MTIHEEALRYIDLLISEQQTRIAAARLAIREFEKERRQILAMAARNGIDPIQVARADDVTKG